MEFPAGGEADIVVPKSKEKKNSHKSRKGDKDIKPRSSSPSEKAREPKELSQTQPPAPAQVTPSPGSVNQAKPKRRLLVSVISQLPVLTDVQWNRTV